MTQAFTSRFYAFQPDCSTGRRGLSFARNEVEFRAATRPGVDHGLRKPQAAVRPTLAHSTPPPPQGQCLSFRHFQLYLKRENNWKGPRNSHRIAPPKNQSLTHLPGSTVKTMGNQAQKIKTRGEDDGPPEDPPNRKAAAAHPAYGGHGPRGSWNDGRTGIQPPAGTQYENRGELPPGHLPRSAPRNHGPPPAPPSSTRYQARTRPAST